MNLEQLTEAVWQRLQAEKPRALLIGEAPVNLQKYSYVNENPYEAVVIGTLSPGELLQMPTDPVCRALLDGIPVYLFPQPYGHGATATELRRELHVAQQRLRRFGVQTPADSRFISAERARQMLRAGEKPPEGRKLTPLARDILEGKAR